MTQVLPLSSIVNARATDLASFTSFTATTNNDGAGKINLAWEIDNGHPSSLSSFSLKRSSKFKYDCWGCN